MNKLALDNLPTIKKLLGPKAYCAYEAFFHGAGDNIYFGILLNQYGGYDIFAPGGEYITTKHDISAAKQLVEQLDRLQKLRGENTPRPPAKVTTMPPPADYEEKQAEAEKKRYYDMKYLKNGAKRIWCNY